MISLKRLVYIFFGFFLAVNSLAALAGNSLYFFDLPTNRESRLTHVSIWSQPLNLYYLADEDSVSLSLRKDSSPAVRIRRNSYFYRFWAWSERIAVTIESPYSDAIPNVVSCRHPSFGIFIFFFKLMTAGICIGSVVCSYISPSLRCTVVLNGFAAVYVLFRWIRTSAGVDRFLSPLFWAAFLTIIFCESRLLFSIARWIPATMAAVTIGTTLALFIGLSDPSLSIYMSLLWLSVPILSWFTFSAGRGMIHPAPLGLHFGLFCIVSATIFFTALSRGFHRPTELSLLNQTVDLSAIAIFTVFQILYAIGDRMESRPPDRSLGIIGRKGQIDGLLDILVAQEEAELRTGTTFE
jgi:hypothetical protein